MAHKNIVYLGWKSTREIKHGYVNSETDYIKILFRPHGSFESVRLEIRQLMNMLEKYFNERGFILIDGRQHIKSNDDVNARKKRVEYKKGKVYKGRK